MANKLIYDYIEKSPVYDLSALQNVYVYLKFKAYLQTTLRLTQKSYSIKTWSLEKRASPTDIEELAYISDTRHLQIPENPYDVEWAISQLEPAQAETIRLHFYESMTDEEIAHLRGVSRQAVNGQKKRALHNLKRLLERATLL